MSALLRLSAGIDRLNAGFAIVADYLVLFAVLVSAGNAVLRYLFSLTSNGLLEVQWYMFAGMVLLGASYTLKLNGHVRVDILYGALSERARLWVDLFGIFVFMLPVLVFLVIVTVPFFLQSLRGGEMSMNAGGLVLWPAKLTLPLGFALLTLQGVSEAIKRIAALTGSIRVDTTYEQPVQ